MWYLVIEWEFVKVAEIGLMKQKEKTYAQSVGRNIISKTRKNGFNPACAVKGFKTDKNNSILERKW